ncbi:MAG: DNA adenine methylase [Chloroflexi bacterium]|nr:DNA adenine methylase [Chloroflexota bacterium]
MLKAPFPWFGGKSKAARLVWSALGDVHNYVEPFAGSLAALLLRPHAPRVETVNDLDHYIVNFWRALQHDPEGVAYHANNPVNEADLTARHIWLVNQGRDRIARTLGDPDYYDAKVAGWWVWGISCWIGGGWCSGKGLWGSDAGRLVRKGKGCGVWRQKAHLGNNGQGVNRKRVHLGGSSLGMGTHKSAIHKDALPQGVNTGAAEIGAYLNTLAARLRYVRVCCGDWQRVVTRGALSNGTTVGVFLDPPYDVSMRDPGCYNTDAEHGNVSDAVREWCIENQDNPRYRIVLAGYEGEHDLPGWRVVEWTAGRAYGTANGADNENRKLERLWLSPHCLGNDDPRQVRMFGED